jgi:hypothetical protein
MGGFAGDRWRELSPCLDHALDLEGEARFAWLEELRSRDPALAEEVRLLLEAKQAIDQEQFLERATVQGPKLGSLAGQTQRCRRAKRDASEQRRWRSAIGRRPCWRATRRSSISST